MSMVSVSKSPACIAVSAHEMHQSGNAPDDLTALGQTKGQAEQQHGIAVKAAASDKPNTQVFKGSQWLLTKTCNHLPK